MSQNGTVQVWRRSHLPSRGSWLMCKAWNGVVIIILDGVSHLSQLWHTWVTQSPASCHLRFGPQTTCIVLAWFVWCGNCVFVHSNVLQVNLGWWLTVCVTLPSAAVCSNQQIWWTSKQVLSDEACWIQTSWSGSPAEAVAASELSGLSPFSVSQERFAELFGQDAAAESRRSQERFRNGLFVGMSLAAGIAVGSFIVMKLLWGETPDRRPPGPASLTPVWRSFLWKLLMM